MTRTARGLAALTAALAAVLTAGTAAQAAPTPGTVPLQAGSQPEGITSQGSTYWAGGRLDGAVYRGDLRTGAREVLVPGVADTAARGMQLDPASRTLWVAGDVRLGPTGGTRSTITAYDADSGALLRRIVVPGQRFLNDVQVTADAVWVTDSLSRELVQVTATGFTLVPMRGDWVQPPAGVNGANGIRLLSTGDLIVTDSSTGDLFRVDPTTGVADRIELTGTQLASGDGLVVRGQTVYVVYGAATNAVVVVHLARDGHSGRVVRTITDPDLDRPTTAVLAAGALYAVNGRFSVPPTPTTPYDVVRVPLR